MTDNRTPQGRPSSSLHQAVGEVSGKLDVIMLTVMPQVRELDTRVTALESWQWRILGGGAVIGFIFTTYEVWHNVLPRR
jgi:hypothetical protein